MLLCHIQMIYIFFQTTEGRDYEKERKEWGNAEGEGKERCSETWKPRSEEAKSETHATTQTS